MDRHPMETLVLMLMNIPSVTAMMMALRKAYQQDYYIAGLLAIAAVFTVVCRRGE